MTKDISAQFKIISNSLELKGFLACEKISGRFVHFKTAKDMPAKQTYIKGSQVYKKVHEFIENNGHILSQNDLIDFNNLLTKKIINAKKSTSSLRGLFLRIFRPKLWLDKVNEEVLIKQLQTTVKKSIKKTQRPIKPSSNQQHTVLKSKHSTLSDSSTSETSKSSKVILAPPPPPPPSQGVGQLSPKQQHELKEQNRLKRLLEERANPDSFYIQTPPNNAHELEKYKKEYEEDIRFLTSASNQLDKASKVKLETLIHHKQSRLREINALLTNFSPIPPFNSQLGNATLTPEFKSKVKKLTNSEIEFLLGQYFDGNAPKLGDLAFPIYNNNKDLFDNIFSKWNVLKKDANNKEFAKHKVEWNRYLGSTLFGFVKALEYRTLPKSNFNYISQLNYTPVPFSNRKSLSSSSSTSSESHKFVNAVDLLKKPLANRRAMLGASSSESSSSSDSDWST